MELIREIKGSDDSDSDDSEVLSDGGVDAAWDGIEDRDCYITMKVVPDLFVPDNSLKSDIVYLYKFHMIPVSDKEIASSGSSGEELLNSLSAMNSLGVAFKAPLPDDVLTSASELFLFDLPMTMAVEFIGQELISIEGLAQMQRFHKAVCCHEDVNASRVCQYLDVNFDFDTFPGDASDFDCFHCMDEDAWSMSSNGGWYIIFPTRPSTPTHLSKYYNNEYVRKCANEAQVMVHNLRLMTLEDTTAAAAIPAEESMCDMPQEDWKNFLILANNMSLCCVAANTPQNKKVLSDFFKTITVAMPAKPFARTPDTVQEICGVSSAEEDNGWEDMVKEGPAPFTSKRVKISYGEYFKTKRPYLWEAVEQYGNDPHHRLVPANQVSTKTTHTLLLSTLTDQIKNSSEWCRRNSVFKPKLDRLHFMPHQCRPVGPLRWFYASRLVPSMMHRLQSLQLAVEARAIVQKRIEESKEAAKVAVCGAALPTSLLVAQREAGSSIAFQFNSQDTSNVENSVDGLVKVNGKVQWPEPDYNHCPTARLMLSALTPKMANEKIDSERLEMKNKSPQILQNLVNKNHEKLNNSLETLGDAFLKYVISVELFRLFPDMREGRLTSTRSIYINNRKLCKVAFTSGVVPYLRALPLSRGEKIVSICPPGMCEVSELERQSIWGVDVIRRPIERKYYQDAMFVYPVRQNKQHMVMYKKCSDMVESIIGAYYIDGGEAAGIAAIKAFKIWPVLPAGMLVPAVPSTVRPHFNHTHMPVTLTPIESSPIITVPGVKSVFHGRYSGNPALLRYPAGAMNGSIQFPTPSAKFATELYSSVSSDGFAPRKRSFSNENFSTMASRESKIPTPPGKYFDKYSPYQPRSNQDLDYDEIETCLRYKFNDRSLLRLALTHTSMSRQVNGERLEFLGDAVLDFVVVSYWFKQNSAYEPCQLHDVKSKNSCNRNLASKAYELGLHRFLQHKSDGLQAQLDEYCSEHAAFSGGKAERKGQGGKESVMETTNKVLADTFEAIIGAIYLDSGEDIRSIDKFAAENDLFVGVL